MKKGVILLVVLFIISVFGYSQNLENLDYVSPLHDGLIAIKKDTNWGFINKEGNMVINFRNDLVTTKSDDGEYPVFKNGRCLIAKENNGILYFGYIDATGKTVIEPQFLNASNFINNEALALHVMKNEIGKNDVLAIKMVNYRYHEVIIDSNGEIKEYLTPKGFSIVLDKKYLKIPPEITSKRITDRMYAVVNESKKWSIVKIN